MKTQVAFGTVKSVEYTDSGTDGWETGIAPIPDAWKKKKPL